MGARSGARASLGVRFTASNTVAAVAFLSWVCAQTASQILVGDTTSITDGLWGWPGLPGPTSPHAATATSSSTFTPTTSSGLTSTLASSTTSTSRAVAETPGPLAERLWPSPIDGYTNGDSSGSLPRKEAPDRDFRHYYRVVALELLLVYHGHRECQTANNDDPRDLASTTEAIEEFQAKHDLIVDALRLDSAFWTRLVIPLKPGDENSAVLALRWLVDATDEASRPPMWDAAAIEHHKCAARFDSVLEGQVLTTPAVASIQMNASSLRVEGVTPELWRYFLNAREARGSAGCKCRAFVVRAFGVSWVVTWFAIATSFALTHTDGWGQISVGCSTPWAVLQRVPRWLRRTTVLFAMMVSHNLAVLGVWSFPFDLFAQLLVGCLFTGGAVVAVRLAAVWTLKQDGKLSISKRFLEVLCFTVGNMGMYFSILIFPYLHGIWFAALLTIMMAFWGLVTGLITDRHQRLNRGGLLFVMCVFTAALPTLLTIGTAAVNKNGLWLTAFVPSCLLVVSVICESFFGKLIVKHCEYTAETQWLLATIFRLCIELVRFDTALAVLLLTLVTESSFGFLLLHLAQTFVFEVMMRQPIRLCLNRRATEATSKEVSEFKLPFTAAEIVLRVGADPWAYRSRAVMAPTELVLFLTHLCQLIFIGMPVGVSHGAWLGGLVLIAFASVSREIVAYLISTLNGHIFPRMPWSKLPGHLIALMLGVGMVMSTFSQVSLFWLMYAHHWAACFIGGKDDTTVESSVDTEVVGACFIALIGIIVLAVDIFSFFSWAVWMEKIKQKQLNSISMHTHLSPAGPQTASNSDVAALTPNPSGSSVSPKRLNLVVHDDASPAPSVTSSSLSPPCAGPSSSALPRQAPHPLGATNAGQTTQSGADELLAQSWDQTLNDLWESENRGASPPENEGVKSTDAPWASGVATKTDNVAIFPETGLPHAIEDEWVGARRLPSKDLHLQLSMELLQQVSDEEQDRSVNELKGEHMVECQRNPLRADTIEEHNRLLKEVLSEMPVHTQDEPLIIMPPPTAPQPADMDQWSLHDNDMKELLDNPLTHTSRSSQRGSNSDMQTCHKVESTVAEVVVTEAAEPCEQAAMDTPAILDTDDQLFRSDTIQKLLGSTTPEGDEIEKLVASEPVRSETVDKLLSKTIEMDDVDDLIDAALENPKSDPAVAGHAGRHLTTAEIAAGSCSTFAPESESAGQGASMDAPGVWTPFTAAVSEERQPSECSQEAITTAATVCSELSVPLGAASRPPTALKALSRPTTAFAMRAESDAPVEPLHKDSESLAIPDEVMVLAAIGAATGTVVSEASPTLSVRDTNADYLGATATSADGGTTSLGADGLAAARELEARLAEQAAKDAATAAEALRLEEAAAAAAEEARRLADEESKRQVEEELRRQAELEAAREAACEAAHEALLEAINGRFREELEQRLEEAREHDVSEELFNEGARVLNELIDEENRAAAAYALSQACLGQNIDEIRLAIGRAKEARVEASSVDIAVARLDDLLAAVARQEAASKRLREVLARVVELPSAPSREVLVELLASLEQALQEANSSGVPAAELQAATKGFSELSQQLRREDAVKAMSDALNAHDVGMVKAALAEAKDAEVCATEVARVERALQDLIEEIELAHDKEKLLKRRIEHAMAAKNEAELVKASSEVEKIMGEWGVLAALRDAIKEAKKTRLVRRGEIQKAEAVLPEITADLKRILADKQLNEKKLAAEKLRADMEQARRAKPTTGPVLAALRHAIGAAQVYRAETRDAETLLASLTADFERATQAAQDGLNCALSSKEADAIKSAIDQCQSLLLDDLVARAMSQIRGIITEYIAIASDLGKEERLALIAKCEILLGILRKCGDEKLRQLHNGLQDLKGALRVFCRVRPMNKKEVKTNDECVCEIVDSFAVRVQRPDRDPEVFSYDAIFGPMCTQPEVFSECRSLVQSAVDGYNTTIFSYGQTGAGKTWTLYGSGQDPGISPRVCNLLFEVVARDEETLRVDVKASMVELYNSDLRDLLNRAKVPPKLDLRNYRLADGTPSVRLEGSTLMPVNSSTDLAQVVSLGLTSRKTRSTHMNADSSRSHLLLVIFLDVTDKATGRTRTGKITIVDLAGSERLAKSGATGTAQKEAIEINKSLTALGDVMMALTSNARSVPYRNHKLTLLMQDSLGGTAKTLMFVNISPASSNVEESVQSLKYASRARCIENDVVRGRAGNTAR